MKSAASENAGAGPGRCIEWREGHTPIITQLELGLSVGLADGTYITKYEQRRRPLSVELLAALAERTGIPIEVLAWPKQLPLLRKLQRALGRPVEVNASTPGNRRNGGHPPQEAPR